MVCLHHILDGVSPPLTTGLEERLEVLHRERERLEDGLYT